MVYLHSRRQISYFAILVCSIDHNTHTLANQLEERGGREVRREQKG